jgi:pimeloyl-ACP methyl ester carboxylesterase
VPAQLPEDLISSTTRPVSIIWGEADPWEDVKLGKKLFASLPPVVEWITLPGAFTVCSAAAQVHRDGTFAASWHGMADSWGALETHNPA